MRIVFFGADISDFYDTIDGYSTNECMICTSFTSRQHDSRRTWGVLLTSSA